MIFPTRNALRHRGTAAALGAIRATATLLIASQTAAIGEPPAPTTTPTPLVLAAPSSFFGSVNIGIAPAPDGTLIEALIGDVVCGTTLTSGARYGIDVNAGYGVGQFYQEGCGASGPDATTVVFQTQGLFANETGTFIGHVAQELNLTFGEAPSRPPPLLPETGAGPDAGAEPAKWARWIVWLGLGLAVGGLVCGLAAGVLVEDSWRRR